MTRGWAPCLVRFADFWGLEVERADATSLEVVPRAGVEPARPFGQGILSPVCLPFHHRGTVGRGAKLVNVR